jgi:bifunctional UDP-N-acetylglucosamine pyrophosphorylase/glucosamine-1-phosphate N-acetyltransferase
MPAHRDEGAAASMATAVLDDPTGYGRVVRDATGEFVEIVEQADCSRRAARDARGVPRAIYCIKAHELLFALRQ